MSRVGRIALSIVFVAAATAWFVLSALVLGQAPASVLTFAAAAVALLASLSVFGMPRADDIVLLRSRGLAQTVVAGLLITASVPAMTFLTRLTDAPSGSESLFFSTAAWGLVGVVVAVIICREQPSLTQVAFALLATLGVAALVANWERPSSFSPFVKFPGRELVMMLAGLSWAVGSVMLSRAIRSPAGRSALQVAMAAGAVMALVWMLLDGGAAAYSPALAPVVVVGAISLSYAALVISWLRLLTDVTLGRVSALWFVVPVVVALLGVVEQSTQPFGPDPVVWAGALAGIVVAIVGAIGVARFSRYDPDDGVLVPRPIPVTAAGIAGVSVVVSAVTLALPSFDASVQGTLSSGRAYEADWFMLGLESAAAWLPLLAGLLLVTASYSALKDWSARRVAWVAVTTLVALAAYPWFVSTPLRTWTRWIPAEVQQEYGTEYALLTMTPIRGALGAAAAALAVLAALLLLAGCVFAFARERLAQRAAPDPEGVV